MRDQFFKLMRSALLNTFPKNCCCLFRTHALPSPLRTSYPAAPCAAFTLPRPSPPHRLRCGAHTSQSPLAKRRCSAPFSVVRSFPNTLQPPSLAGSGVSQKIAPAQSGGGWWDAISHYIAHPSLVGAGGGNAAVNDARRVWCRWGEATSQ